MPSADPKALRPDGSVALTGNLNAGSNRLTSVADPSSAQDAATKNWVESNYTADHGSLTGLGDDDHTQYVLVDGTRAFTGEVAGVTPTSSSSLATKGYIDGNYTTDHGSLGGLADDDHTQYSRADGTRAFTAEVAGVSPTSSTGLTTKGYVDGKLLSLAQTYGLSIAHDADTDHDINMSPGSIMNSGRTLYGVMSSAVCKQIDATWAAGDDAGGLASGVTLANNTWYHCLPLMKADGTCDDWGFDTSISGTNLLADANVIAAGYTAIGYRSGYGGVGSVLTNGSANIVAFSQEGNEFLWSAAAADYSATNPGTSAVLQTLSVPPSIKCHALNSVNLYDDTYAAVTYLLITSPDQADTTPAFLANDIRLSTGISTIAIQKVTRTNTSRQIRFRLSSSTADHILRIFTNGWIDPRARAK